jgi:spermidine synthase
MVFPLLISSIRPANAHPPGRTLAQLLAMNGVGGLLGAEIAHRLLLPSLGVHLALGALGASYGLVAFALAVALKGRRALSVALPIGSVAATCLLLTTSLKRAPLFLHGSTFNLLELHSGREGALAIAERPDVGRAMFLDNHYMLGCSAGAADMQRQAHLPLLLHRHPKQVCFIGLGTGITAAGALKHGAVESIVAIELCPLVAEAAARHFGQFNQDLALDPKARVHVEDARTYIASAENRFDAIVGDLFTPWRPGEARLCSFELFTAAKAALRPGACLANGCP